MKKIESKRARNRTSMVVVCVAIIFYPLFSYGLVTKADYYPLIYVERVTE